MDGRMYLQSMNKAIKNEVDVVYIRLQPPTLHTVSEIYMQNEMHNEKKRKREAGG